MLFGLSVFLFLAVLTAGCANDKRNASRKSSKSKGKSGRSGKSSKSGRSSRKSSKRSSKSKKSRKSSKSGRKSKSGKSSSSKRQPKRKSASDLRVQAAISADKMAAKSAIQPSSEMTTHSECSEHEGHNITYANIRVIPHEIIFKQIGGLKTIRIKNSTPTPIVYMIKCSDNMLYSITPVYGSIGANEETNVNILRENGIAKHDKLILITAKQEGDVSPAHIFAEMYKKNSLDYNVNMVPLIARN
ncbi:unnamed protein product [Caenorhabditis angaria]|uniref:Major sperm protein n=1 Tax=Caenorhabditis angaria TaxID=860376 RepID=A0A9P1N5V5_9PELO|nr:unnamed protein product [Caenorhabditis angaria]